MNEKSRPKSVRESLERLLGYNKAPSVDVILKIFGDWAAIVGNDIAQHTRPVKIDGDQLTVAASDPAWADEFRWLEAEVVKRLETVTGSGRIKRLKVQVQRRE